MTTVQVTLPDGSQREAPAGTTSRQIAEGIGPGPGAGRAGGAGER